MRLGFSRYQSKPLALRYGQVVAETGAIRAYVSLLLSVKPIY